MRNLLYFRIYRFHFYAGLRPNLVVIPIFEWYGDAVQIGSLYLNWAWESRGNECTSNIKQCDASPSTLGGRMPPLS
jgi:hypothetical protein